MTEMKVTLELCAEDRKRLDDILEGLVRWCDSCVELMAQAPAKAEEPDCAAPVTMGQVPEHLQPEYEAPATESQEEAPAVKKADIQKLVVTLSAADKKDKVREIVQAYAKKVSDIPEDKLGEVFQKLTALQEG